MTAPLTRTASAVVALLFLAAPAAAAVTVGHVPLECVAIDRYTQVVARGTPAGDVAAAELQFRTGSAGAWYSVVMSGDGGEWAALLPRPAPALARFEYRIVMRASDLEESAMAPVAVRVADAAACGDSAASTAAAAAPIAVRVPRGAPLVPPVPAGFSPVGVVAVVDPVRRSMARELVIGAGLAGGIVAAVVLGAGALEQPERVEDLPGFAFAGTRPPPGSVLSSDVQLSAFLLLTGRTTIPFAFAWTFEMLEAGGERVCASMGGPASIATTLPATVTLTGELTRVSACGERFDVDRARLRVLVDNLLVFDAIQAPLPFRFEP